METLGDKAYDFGNMLRETAAEVLEVGKQAVRVVVERISDTMDDALDVFGDEE